MTPNSQSSSNSHSIPSNGKNTGTHIVPTVDAASKDSWHNCDDEQLMVGISDRTQGALAALYDRYAPHVLNLCRRITAEGAVAEDAMIETFAELWQRPDRFDSTRGTPLTYLLILARCRALDIVRSENAHHLRPKRAAEHKSASVLAENAVVGDDLARSLHTDNDADSLDAALRQLGPKCRDAVHLCVINGLTANQAAVALNVPLGTMKSRIRKGIIQMRQLLRTHDERAMRP